MKGLEATEQTLSEARSIPDFRIDAEFFEKLPPEAPHLQWSTIGEHLSSSQYGLSMEMNDEGDGYPIYRMNEIDQMLCVEDLAKCAPVSDIEAQEFFLNPRDVLFNRTNSQLLVGRTGLFLPFDHNPRIFASYLVRFVPNQETLLPEYLVAFLNSKRGRTDIKRRARISINQSNVNPEEVKATRIPLLDMKIQKRVATLFQVAHGRIVEARKTLGDAERLLLAELGLLKWKQDDSLTYERSAAEVCTGERFDAEFYAPHVQTLLTRLRSQNTTIGNVAQLRKSYFQPDVNQTFNYIEIGDVSQDGEARAFPIEGMNAPSRATWCVEQGDVITSTVRPIRRLSALIQPEQKGYVCSSGFAVLEPTKIPSELLLLYLRLPIICELMDLHTTASMYPAISVTSILALPFLSPSDTATKKILKLVQKAGILRRSAHALLASVGAAVELAMEEGEPEALRQLKGISV